MMLFAILFPIHLCWASCARTTDFDTCGTLPLRAYDSSLQHPGLTQMGLTSPDAFQILFGTTSYNGGFVASCERSRAPLWVDRIFNLVLNGYYDDNYFFRVIDSETLHVVQFGTGGNPETSAPYNFAVRPCLFVIFAFNHFSLFASPPFI
jgi:hypothetical protein